MSAERNEADIENAFATIIDFLREVDKGSAGFDKAIDTQTESEFVGAIAGLDIIDGLLNDLGVNLANVIAATEARQQAVRILRDRCTQRRRRLSGDAFVERALRKN